MTLDELKAYGADVDTGLRRCANKEALYLRLVEKVPKSDEFGRLKESIEKKEFDNAFELAHGLKGILTNLALTPLSDPVSEITELLRSRQEVDYSSYLACMEEALEKLKAITG